MRNVVVKRLKFYGLKFLLILYVCDTEADLSPRREPAFFTSKTRSFALPPSV